MTLATQLSTGPLFNSKIALHMDDRFSVPNKILLKQILLESKIHVSQSISWTVNAMQGHHDKT